MAEPNRATDPGIYRSLRRRVGAMIVDNMFRGMARAGRLHPLSRPERHQVEILGDIPYRTDTSPALKLDIYRPTAASGPLPIILYIHGGGFRILSKDTHWVMGLSFARKGYLVFNIDYRLAPVNPFPAAAEDSAAALAWVVANAARFGGDLDRVSFAGESAGANLITVLALASSYRRDEPWARAVFDLGIRPRAVLAACGMFQVSDPGRFGRRKANIPSFINDRIHEVSESYLGAGRARADGALDLADPLVLLERGAPPDRPLSPFFLPVGTRDPLLDDTRRLKVALDKLNVPCEVRYYPGEVHAFHAMVWRENARRCWDDTFAFLAQHDR